VARNSKVGKKKSQDRRPKPSVAGGRPRRGRPKICIFCSQHATWVDYKDVTLLRRFINDRGRIRARGATGTCAQHQRDVATAVKTARELAMLPYAVRTVTSESRGGRGGDRRGNGRGPTTEESSGSEAPEASSDSGDRVDESENVAADEMAEMPVPATA
jgi:ribosomal protein S18